MDLSKADDCLSHELLIAKLAAYGLNMNSLYLMYSYLNNRSQRGKIGSHKSTAMRTKTWGPIRIGAKPFAF